MIEFTDSHFDRLCQAGPVRTQIATSETTRSGALKRFWLFLIGGIVISCMAGLLLGSWIVFAILLFGTILLCRRPLAQAGRSLKDPVLQALAAEGGMEYSAAGFEPPVFEEARKPLFGGLLSSTTFTDMLRGKDEEGRDFAIYEATLEQGYGKSRQQIFSGQVYAFKRRPGSQAQTVIVPDRGLFNFFKPGKGMERVKFEGDLDFEKRFEVYSTNPAEARSILASDTFRRQLLELRSDGKLFAFIGAEDTLVAVTGKDRFESGSMFKSIEGEVRVRTIFEDVCASLAVLKKLEAGLG